MTARLLQPALLLLVLHAAGCGPEPSETRISYRYVIRSDQPTSSITINGVHIVIDNQLSIASVTPETLGTANSLADLGDRMANLRFTIAGALLSLRKSRLFLGDSDYGRVSPGDDVLIDPAGVSVNGELRGVLP